MKTLSDVSENFKSNIDAPNYENFNFKRERKKKKIDFYPL